MYSSEEEEQHDRWIRERIKRNEEEKREKNKKNTTIIGTI